MHISARTFWLQKAGSTAEEYEDAFWPANSIDLDLNLFRAAVADGATETSFAGAWARILVRAYCKDQITEKRLGKNLPRLQEEWAGDVGDKVLPWYAEQKAAQGAFATLTGLTLFGSRFGSTPRWECTSIGDSCLFQVRGTSTVAAFPLEHSSQFGSRPVLLSSRAKVAEGLSSLSGFWQSGDVFYLMTDAIAAWFLRFVEANESAPLLPNFNADGSGWPGWVSGMRSTGAMKNDDVTLVRIEVT